MRSSERQRAPRSKHHAGEHHGQEKLHTAGPYHASDHSHTTHFRYNSNPPNHPSPAGASPAQARERQALTSLPALQAALIRIAKGKPISDAATALPSSRPSRKQRRQNPEWQKADRRDRCDRR